MRRILSSAARSLRLVWIASIFAFLVFVPLPASGDIPFGMHVAIPQRDLLSLSDRIRTQLVLPVSENLLAHYEDDADLAELLQTIQFHVLTIPEDARPNARAERFGATRRIELELDLVAGFNQLAEVAGLIRMEDEALFGLLDAPTRRFQDLVRSGRHSALSFQFDVDHSVHDPQVRAMVEHLALDSLLSVTTWIILHEIAHHQLCHLEPTPCGSNAPWTASIYDQEIDADRWALEQMRVMGFSLFGLRSALAAKAVLIDLEREALGLPPAQPTDHPTYWQRVAMVDEFLARDQLRDETFRWFAVAVEEESDPRRWRVLEYPVPINPHHDGVIAAVIPEGGSRPLVGVEQVQQTIRLYGRDDVHFSEMVFSEINRPVARVTFRHRRISDGTLTGVQRMAYRVNWANIQHVRIGDVTVREILGTRPVDVFIDALQQAGVSPQRQLELERTYLNSMSQIRLIIVEFARGRRSLQDAQARIQSVAEQMSSQLRRDLGDEQFGLFERAVYRNSVVGLGMERYFQIMRQ